ncbi:MAG: LOG family protein [Gammaproteobacteria bacterium]|nr:LOG family protein [Gammaproteobacteria bacterium]
MSGQNTRISPVGSLEVLSQIEASNLTDRSDRGLHELFRRCCLAVLNSGENIDDARAMLAEHEDFDIELVQQERGLKLHLKNAPHSAFVDGVMIKGMQENLFAVLRDIVYVNHEIMTSTRFDLEKPEDITNAVFHILRHAGTLTPLKKLDLVVCWGGHSISREEYDYTKLVGYQLGLRGLNVITGCGPGAMKGPMKGATIGHAKQRISAGRYIGITEPGIIAAEAPNPIVNDLVIMPDIEKRLEAFVRTGHGITVFPGGAGTAEEILYLLGIRLHPDNKDIPLPFIWTGPKSSADYFRQLDEFVSQTLGPAAQQLYTIIIDDPARVATELKKGFTRVREFRKECNDAYYFNWKLTIDANFQQPFNPTHENMAKLNISTDQEQHRLAANLRRVFSGIVAGNVKEQGVRSIEEHGPFEISGEQRIMTLLDELLASFAAAGRMKLHGKYTPCYRLAK